MLDSGTYNIHPAVTKDMVGLAPGVQQGVITFMTQDGYFSADVTINAYYGLVEHIYLPMVR